MKTNQQIFIDELAKEIFEIKDKFKIELANLETQDSSSCYNDLLLNQGREGEKKKRRRRKSRGRARMITGIKGIGMEKINRLK